MNFNEQNSYLVERPHQLQLLLHSLNIVSGESKCMINLVTGDAGTGKTTICELFLDKVAELSPTSRIARAFCSLQCEFSLPYAPFKEILKQLFLSAEPINKTKDTTSRLLNIAIKETLEHAPELICSFIPCGSIISKFGEGIISEMGLLDKFKSKAKPDDKINSLDERTILAQYTEILRILSKDQPLIITIDDFHWADTASINLLYYLSRSLNGSRVMLIISYRSSDISVIKNGERHALIQVINEIKRNFGNVITDLDEISNDERLELLNKIIDKEPNTLNKQFRESMFQITNGNPLFVNEMFSSLKDNFEVQLVDDKWTENIQINWEQKPARIEGIVEERISRLEDALVELLSHASVQGNRFIAQILSKTINENERDVLTSLSRKLQKEHHLVRETKCFRSGASIISEYQFSNYIFQHYLYEELSQSQRILLHGDIAENLVSIFQDSIDEVALEIAQHYELSGEPTKSVAFFILAGKAAMKVSQFKLAFDILTKTISYIDSANQSFHEKVKFDVLSLLSICTRSIYGWGDKKTIELYNEIIKLGKNLGEIEKCSTYQFGIWAVYLNKLELHSALDYAKQFLESAIEIKDKCSIIQAKLALANTYFWMNNQSKSLEIIKELDDSIDEKEISDFIEKYGQTPQSLLLMFKLITNLIYGDVDQMTKALSQAETYVETTNHLYSKAIVLTGITWTSYMNFDYSNAKKYSAQLVDLCLNNNYNYYYGLGLFFQCWSQLNDTLDEHWDERFKNAEELIYSNQDVVLLKSDFQLTKVEYYLNTKKYDLALDMLQVLTNKYIQSEEKVTVPRLYYYLALTQNYRDNKKESIEAIVTGLQNVNQNCKVNITEMKLLRLFKKTIDVSFDKEYITSYSDSLNCAINRCIHGEYMNELSTLHI